MKLNNRNLNIFGEGCEIPKALVHSYIRTVIVRGFHRSQLYFDSELVGTIGCSLPAQSSVETVEKPPLTKIGGTNKLK